MTISGAPGRRRSWCTWETRACCCATGTPTAAEDGSTSLVMYWEQMKGLDLFLFGHTHKPLVDMRGRTLFLNPGSIGDYARPTYGIVTLENGNLDVRTALLRS